MEAIFSVTGECRKVLVETVKALVDDQNTPSFAYVIGNYTVIKTGTVFGPANEALIAALNAKGLISKCIFPRFGGFLHLRQRAAPFHRN